MGTFCLHLLLAPSPTAVPGIYTFGLREIRARSQLTPNLSPPRPDLWKTLDVAADLCYCFFGVIEPRPFTLGLRAEGDKKKFYLFGLEV